MPVCSPAVFESLNQLITLIAALWISGINGLAKSQLEVLKTQLMDGESKPSKSEYQVSLVVGLATKADKFVAQCHLVS